MVKNRAHHENPRELINKIVYGPPKGAVNLLILSINSFLNNEIADTVKNKPPQSSLLFIGIHSVAQTLGEVLFGERSVKGYRKFLEEFIDGSEEDNQYSLIANEIHSWRNILAHGWLSLRGFQIEYDYEMKEGFKKMGNDLYINPKIYLNLYLSAFNNDGRIVKYINNMNKLELSRSQKVIKDKYLR